MYLGYGGSNLYREHEHQSGGGELKYPDAHADQRRSVHVPSHVHPIQHVALGLAQRYSCREMYKLIEVILKVEGKAYISRGKYELRNFRHQVF